MINQKKRHEGIGERYKKRFCLRCMVSFSNQSLHICQGFLKLNYIVQFVKDILQMNFVLNLTRWKSYLVNLKVTVIFWQID